MKTEQARVALTSGLLAFLLACAGGTCDRREPSLKLMHQRPILTLPDGVNWLGTAPPGVEPLSPKLRPSATLALYDSRKAKQKLTVKLGPLTTEAWPAYGSTRHWREERDPEIAEGLTSNHRLLQVETSTLSAADCDALRAWLKRSYQSSGAEKHGLAMSYEYAVHASGHFPLSGQAGACSVRVAFHPPLTKLLDSESNQLPLPNEHRLPFLIAWRDLVPKAATGATAEALEPEIQAIGLPDDLEGALRERLDVVRQVAAE